MVTAQPHDLDAESIVIGSCALSADAIDAAASVVRPSDFYGPLHASTFAAVLELHASGDAVDPFTLAARVEGLDPKKVTDWESMVSSAAAVSTHAARVADQARRRDLARVALDLDAAARNGAAVAEVIARGTKRLDRIGSEAAGTDGLLDGIRNGAWLDGQDFPPLNYTVPGLIPEGLVLLVGPPKIGKSWFVLLLALAVGFGGRALGAIPVRSRQVLYLALEDGDRRLQDRCRKLLEPGEAIPPRFEYLTRVRPGEVVTTISRWLDQHTDGLVILDTLGKVMPPALAGESSYGRDYRIGSALKDLVDDHPGSSLVVNHHDRKADADDFVDAVSGTHGLAGSADTIIVLSRRRHEQAGLLKVTGRDIPEGEYAVTFQAGARWQLTGGDLDAAAQAAEQNRVTDGLDQRSREVIAYVNEHPEGVRAKDLAEALDLGDHTARTYLARMAEGDRIARHGRGLYTPVASVASVANNGSPERNNATYATHPQDERTLLDEEADR